MTQTELCISILGASGSIGVQTIEVVLANQTRKCSIELLSVHKNWNALSHLLTKVAPKYLAVTHQNSVEPCKQLIKQLNLTCQIVTQQSEILDICSASHVTHIICATSGIDFLQLYYQLALRGKHLLIANKESLVVGGSYFIDAVRLGKARITPLDSEPHAIYQCINNALWRSCLKSSPEIETVTITASGGPFVSLSKSELEHVKIADALNHPTWKMGKKISIDSATLINKGLEIIECCRLFTLKPNQIKTLIHRQSLVHGFVSFVDGSVLINMYYPTMKIPIAYGIFETRLNNSDKKSITVEVLNSMCFEEVDQIRFPSITLCYLALANGDCSTVALTAANEIAVDSFLSGKIPFNAIIPIIERVVTDTNKSVTSFIDLIELYKETLAKTEEVVKKVR
ncbi:MAG: 1-deoxy-D-xylulose-5-phosphate reductoisomerase [Methylacidiphilales bacterium]|nr:1-deoxy-D-xylulose-5-phosphate reductoisomerase [Candidatus Methylacidiphilales bacterium]